ncbi:hypothetical protein DV736_g3382, partial [Chaetothyriales sp. CBS 134916]
MEAKKTSRTQTCPRGGNDNHNPYQHKRMLSAKTFEIPFSMQVSVQDVAVNFLLGDYIRGSHFDYLPSLYNTDTSKDVLGPIVGAVGFASLALHSSRHELQDKAQKLYIDAISHTNTALHRPDAAHNDDILASILLLSLYETLTARSPLSIGVWAAHIRGALSLVALRGPAQLESELGMALFKQLLASVRVFCIQHFIRVPPQLHELWQMANCQSNEKEIAYEFSCVVEAFTDLRADRAEGILTRAEDIIVTAEGLLQTIEDLCTKLTSDLLYDTVITSKACPELHAGYYHRFKDHHVAQGWNTIWMAQINLHSLIHAQIAQLLSNQSRLDHEEVDLVNRMDKCQEMAVGAADNICASVPQFFPPEDDRPLASSPPTAAMGYFLIWPLFTAGAGAFTSPRTKDYIIKRLDFIGTEVKVPQAHAVASMLRDEIDFESSMHIYHVF